MENMYFVFLMGVVVGVVATCIVGFFGYKSAIKEIMEGFTDYLKKK